MELNQEQLQEIDAALIERHPLFYQNMGLADIFPFLWYLSPCCRRRKGDLDTSRSFSVGQALRGENAYAKGVSKFKMKNER